MTDQPDYESERPWTEAQWLAEFRRSEVRTARFGELLETLMDHPDRDALIAREMGWDRDRDDAGFVESPFDAENSSTDSADLSALKSDDDEFDSADDGPTDLLHDNDCDDRAEGLPLLSDVPAYRAAVELTSVAIGRRKRFDEMMFADPRHEELFGELVGNLLIPAVKIRSGHSYGYDDKLCANIVYQRFALKAAQTAERALNELELARMISAEDAGELQPRLRELIRLLYERIEELRARVWW